MLCRRVCVVLFTSGSHERRLPAAGGPRRWLGLKALRHEVGTADSAIVEAIARYKAGGRANELRETSRFVREGGRWLYVDGNAG